MINAYLVVEMCRLVGWFAGWLIERLTAASLLHRHNLHQRISGSAPETSLLPSPPASDGLLDHKRQNTRRTRTIPKQATNELRSPTATGYQFLAKQKSSRDHTQKHQPSDLHQAARRKKKKLLGLYTAITGNTMPLCKMRFPASPTNFIMDRHGHKKIAR